MTSPAAAPINDEAAVRALHQAMLDMWNQRNAAGMAALYQPFATVVGFDGSQHTSAAELGTTMANIFAHHPTGSYVGRVRQVRFLGSDTAMLLAVVGMVPAGKKELNPALNAVQSMVAQREEGGWRIALFQNTPAAYHGRPEAVEALTSELKTLLPG